MGDAEPVRLSINCLLGGRLDGPLVTHVRSRAPRLTGPEKSFPEAQGDAVCTALPNTRGLSWGWLRSWVSSLRLAALNSHSCCFLEMRRKRHFRMLQGEKEDRARARSHSSPNIACAALGFSLLFS